VSSVGSINRFHTEIEVDLANPEDAGAAFRDALANHRVVSVRARPGSVDGMDDDALRACYDRVVEAMGEPVDIAESYSEGGAPTGERWSEIRYNHEIPDMEAFRHSKNAQPLHTDESYVSTGIGVMVFYCAQAASSGGETVFVDGPVLAEHLASNDPELFEALTSVTVEYRKADDAKAMPILRVDGGEPLLNFNYFCVGEQQSQAAIDLNLRFHRYLEDELPQELIHPVGLARGDSVAWRDDLVLHGRNSFAAEKTGDRTIWKTGVILP